MAKDNATNRKLSTLTKGTKGSSGCVQVPTASWYWSHSKAEIYHYDNGVFEAYPEATWDSYHAHHTIKVPAEDSVWKITHTTDRPIRWQDLLSQDDIEQTLIWHNEQHLRQTEQEGGISTWSPLLEIRGNFRINSHTADILCWVEYTTLDLDPEMTAFFSALHSPQALNLPPIDGTLSSADVQMMFQRAKEWIPSLYYPQFTLWKCLTTDDIIAGILSVVLSLPFLYGFVNPHWSYYPWTNIDAGHLVVEGLDYLLDLPVLVGFIGWVLFGGMHCVDEQSSCFQPMQVDMMRQTPR